MKRRTGDPGTPGAKARRQKEPGLWVTLDILSDSLVDGCYYRFDTITNAVKSIFNPNLKRSDTLIGGGLEAIVKRWQPQPNYKYLDLFSSNFTRYDKYWKTRRSSAGKPNWELNTPRKQARSEVYIMIWWYQHNLILSLQDISGTSGESFIGPDLPPVKKEAGSGFYQDRGRVSDYYFDDDESQ